jgi:hypothetical protein
MSASYTCHDFKSPRNDSSRRLPGTMRIVPVLFYVIIVFFISSLVRSYQVSKDSESRTTVANANRDEHNAKKTELTAKLTDLTTQEKLGSEVAKWVEGTRGLQPIIASIVRAVGEETFISNLMLERSPDVPSQINLSIKLSNAGQPETDKIGQALNTIHYKSHSPSVGRSGDELEYRSMLVWQEK